MNVADLKRFILRALARMSGIPMRHDFLLVELGNLQPQPLISDCQLAIRELEVAGFISGDHDDLDPELTTWTLTPKGAHKAKQLQ